MKKVLSVIAIVAVFSGIVYLIYKPLLKKNSKDSEDIIKVQKKDSKELIFCSDPWPPYAGYVDEKQQGYIIDIVRKIYQPKGYKIKFINIPWSRCIKETRDGKITALAGADFKEVPDFKFPKKTIGVTFPTFFGKSTQTWQYDGPKSLDKINCNQEI